MIYAPARDPRAVALAVERWLRPRRADMLAFLDELVAHDSPSGDLVSLRRTAAFLRSWLPGLVTAHELNGGEHGEHLVCRLGPAGDPGYLLLCHYDTVWPVATARERPFAVAGESMTGPGVFDMKASIVMAAFALRAVDEVCGGFRSPVCLSLTPDEEIGNPSSRPALEALARRASTVLVLEPPLPGGALKTRRKGVAQVHIVVEGISAHAGLDPDRGASAALEVAHLVLAAAGLADADHGTTVNVGVVRAGERRNVVPASGEIAVDVRGWDEREIHRVIETLKSSTPTIDGARISVKGFIHRPPMIRREDIDPALLRAREAASALGVVLEEGEAGGGSEANLTAPLAPTLDGLGPEGGGAHGLDERVDVESFYQRTALLAALIADGAP